MGSNRAICTIIAGNYLAYARVLCESYRALHPGDRCFVLVVDDCEGLLDPAGEPFEVVRPRELGIPDYHPHFTFKYNVTELSTAVKPPLMELLMRDRGVEKLLYLDPDILVLHSLDPLYDRLDRADAVVTPHTMVDFPDDGHLPDDATILRAGVFNLGFLGVADRPAGREFLAWWRAKLAEKCLQDVSTGYFVDQKFIDLAICLYPGFHIERDPGYNVAYWNLHARRVALEGGEWRCDGGPLRFFHFSGINVGDERSISKYQTRFDFSTMPGIEPLFRLYRDRVLSRGHGAVKTRPYGYGRFHSGLSIPDSARTAYRRAYEAGVIDCDPFDHAALAGRLPECGPALAALLMGQAYDLIQGGDLGQALRRVDEACLYDSTERPRRARRGYRRWAAKLWLKDRLLGWARPGRPTATVA